MGWPAWYRAGLEERQQGVRGGLRHGPGSWGQGLVLRWGGCYGGRCKRRDIGVLPSGLSSLKEGEHGGPVPREPLVLGGWGKPCHQDPCLRGDSPDFSESLSEGGKSLSSQEA